MTLSKFDLMDGAPVKGEVIPVRLFLGGNPGLTPTYRNVYNKFSVKYFLNLVIVDENNRRYFKQQEIVLWRKAPLRVLKSGAEPRQPEAAAAAAEQGHNGENSQEKEFSLPTPRTTPQTPLLDEPSDNNSSNNNNTQENTEVVTATKKEEGSEAKKEGSQDAKREEEEKEKEKGEQNQQ